VNQAKSLFTFYGGSEDNKRRDFVNMTEQCLTNIT